MSGKKIHQTHFTQPEMPWRNKEEETVELKRERPIIFNTEMVGAILEGRKTQTRRVIKPQPTGWNPLPGLGNLWWWCVAGDQDFSEERRCPYGKSGDQLWLRETFAEMCKLADPHCWCEYPSGEFNPDHYIEYRADSGNKYPGDWDDADKEEQKADYVPRWRPSIHMFRWMSRIQLEVVSVKVERVQDIQQGDICAEGIWNPAHSVDNDYSQAYEAWVDLWDLINKKRGFGWDVNPWVWVVEFKVIEVKNAQ